MAPFFDITLAVLVALLSVAAGMWWLERRSSEETPVPSSDAEVALLFEAGVLHHATDLALAQLGLETGVNDWSDLRERLQDRFPNIPDTASPGPRGCVTLRAVDRREPSRLRISWQGSLCRVTLGRPGEGQGQADPPLDSEELLSLRRACDSAPNPIWEVDKQGRISWYNLAYQSLYERHHGRLPDADTGLFDQHAQQSSKRKGLTDSKTGKEAWYEVTSEPVDGVTMYHATSISAVVEAEEARRNFVQTLAKTFAHLPIGLAIFDRDGRLALFNPALVDLTALTAEFLSARPTMLSFFDQLRENRHMPEPKNYLSWRENITRLITEANHGHYEETWTLESGQTYSMIGRPHPDGATAFLIEDISAEVALTRNFRAELELSQSLLDTLEDALAVFTSTGTLSFCNASYRSLWRVDPDRTFAEVTIADAIHGWRQASVANPMWPDVEETILHISDRSDWEMPVRLLDGSELVCQITPVATGATMVRFRPSQTSAPTSGLARSSRAD